ncbi:MAG: carbamoyltransferase [Candidatus Glassbacteria bacterium]
MYILGISAFYHDSAAALVKDGEIVAAAQEERFTRKKHDYNFPDNAIDFCLRYEGITPAELSLVVFYDKPLIKFERILESYISYAPIGIKSFIKSMPVWIKQKLWIKNLLYGKLEGYDGKILFPEHHESHAASAFYPSPFKEAAFLTVDGVGEWTTTSYGIGKGNDLRILAEQSFPHSLGMLYSAFTYFTGFKVNSGEYKLMGLAPYGEPKYVNVILDNLIDLKEDGSFKLNMRYFNYCVGLTMTNRRFARLFGGKPRKPETKLTQRDMDLARSIQVVTEEIMLRMARYVHAETGLEKLVLAGGCALNCVSNGRILREGPFEDIWIQPAAGDAGGALGAALIAWYRYLGKNRNPDGDRDFQKASYLGPEYTDGEIEQFLKSQKAPYERLSREEIGGRIAKLIAEGNVVGWFQGRMEFGPRALGSRSIIGDARSPEMQSKMNLKIKFRESFRPFAPTVLNDYVSEYFEIDRHSPYMLLVAGVSKDKLVELGEDDRKLMGVERRKAVRSTIPAVTHVDNSARLQTVERDDNPMYYDMIEAFRKLTGCPVIINTSFNVRGEPIVCSPEHAYTCFMRTHMDYLLLGNFLLDKTKQKKWEEDFDWREEFELD